MLFFFSLALLQCTYLLKIPADANKLRARIIMSQEYYEGVNPNHVL